MASAYLFHPERIMNIKIEFNEEDAEEMLELVRDLTSCFEEMRAEIKELKRLCDEQKKMS
jgi:ribosome recycling factor